MKGLKLDLDADIFPNEGLGGLKLRVNVSRLERIEGFPFKQDSYYLVSPFEARYRLGEGAIEAAVDIRSGKVFKLSAMSGYSGKLFGKIFVGMPIKEAMKIEPGFFYDEAEEVIVCKGVPGLTIDIPEIDPPVEKVPHMSIYAISVFVENILTLSGQEGNW